MTLFYPTLVTDRFAETVSFYEDHFGFMPAIEQDGYVLLKCARSPEMCIAVFDVNHACVTDVVPSVRGVIVNIIIDDVKAKFDELYMEGLSIYSEVKKDINGNDHFIVYDPNGILVNVHAPMVLEPA